jgi:hypothetical protein
MIRLKSLLTERKVYHGTISDFANAIEKSGILKSPKSGAIKVSGGLTTEMGLIWVTPDINVADMYANGIESGNEYNLERGIVAHYGGIIELEIDDNLKLIDRNAPLTQEQIDILNSKFIPHYKPLKVGDSLSNAEWRSNGKQLHDMILALGFDGITYSNGKQIGIATDSLPIKAFVQKVK